MRIKLERLKTKSGEKWISSKLDKKVYIYSAEWGCYWRPDRNGYTYNKSDAGVYTFSDAWNASSHCGPEKRIQYEYAGDLPTTQEERGKAKLMLRAA